MFIRTTSCQSDVGLLNTSGSFNCTKFEDFSLISRDRMKIFWLPFCWIAAAFTGCRQEQCRPPPPYQYGLTLLTLPLPSSAPPPAHHTHLGDGLVGWRPSHSGRCLTERTLNRACWKCTVALEHLQLVSLCCTTVSRVTYVTRQSPLQLPPPEGWRRGPGRWRRWVPDQACWNHK